MNALDKIRTAHRRARTAEVLEQALRDLCDLLTGDELDGEDLCDAIERSVIGACDALDSWEHPGGDKLPPPPDPPSDDHRLCGLSDTPIGTCHCTACTARRDGIAERAGTTPSVTIGTSSLEEVSAAMEQGVAAAEEMADRLAEDLGRGPALRTCRGCGEDKPAAAYARNGKGPMKTCRECMSAIQREAQAKRKKARARGHADDKESV